MSKRISLVAAALLIFSATSFVAAQTTTTTVTQTPTTVTKTVQHPDGTYTVIEYPVGKEVKIDLTPVSLTNSKGVATILRDDNGTRVVLNLTGVPAEVKTVNLYAVDPTGAVTALGPVTVSNGTGTFTATTPLNQFMLVGADEGLTTYDPNTKVFFRSAVPEGFAVIPHTTVPVGEQVAATTATPATPVAATTTITTPVVTTATTTTPVAVTATTTTTATTPVYTVPMLNIPAYEKGDDTKIKVNFSGALSGARANVFITPNKAGAAKVKMVFHELKDVPAGKVFTAWAISPDNKFTKLGQISNTGTKNEAEIQSDVTFPDFGLLVTMEDATATSVSPLGPSIGIVEIIR